MAVDRVSIYRIVDLSTIVERDNPRLHKLARYKLDETFDYHTKLTCDSHLGTHVESPYHFHDHWPDLASLPASAFMGTACLVRLKVPPRAPITPENFFDQLPITYNHLYDMIVLLDSEHHCEPFSEDESDQRPRLTKELAAELARARIKALGFGDGISIEHDVQESLAIHAILMSRNIVMIEVLRNCDQLHDPVFFFAALPMPIRGLDSSCVRAVAIEGMQNFTHPLP